MLRTSWLPPFEPGKGARLPVNMRHDLRSEAISAVESPNLVEGEGSGGNDSCYTKDRRETMFVHLASLLPHSLRKPTKSGDEMELRVTFYCFLASKLWVFAGLVTMPKTSVPPPTITMLKVIPAIDPLVIEMEPVQSGFTV